MLDEKALRKPGFAEGVPIKLHDGQEWHFPVILFRFNPAEDADGTIRLGQPTRYVRGAVLNHLFEPSDEGRGIDVLLAASVGLLRVNYDLTIGDLGELLPVISGDANNAGMWQELASYVGGFASPKAMTSGSEPS